MPEQPLHEKLAGMFHELSQHVFGKAIPIKKMERMNTLARKFGQVIIQAAERTALLKCKALNDAVKKGFGMMATDVAELQQKVTEAEAHITAVDNVVSRMSAELEEYKDKVAANHHFLKEFILQNGKTKVPLLPPHDHEEE